MTFEKELEQIINKYSKEQDSNTPDFILAQYLNSCLHAYNEALKARTKRYSPEIDKDICQTITDQL